MEGHYRVPSQLQRELRDSIVSIVLDMNSTADDIRRFKEYYDESLATWAEKMLKLSEWGDEVCLKARLR